MIVSPFGMWARGLLSLLIIGSGLYFLSRWHDELPTGRHGIGEQLNENASQQPLDSFRERVAAWEPGWNQTTALLIGSLALLSLSVGGCFVNPRLWLQRAADEPKHERSGEVQKLRRPDGNVLHVEVYGDIDGPPVVLTHGWGGDATEWYYLKRSLSKQYRVIVWDLPGSGLSTQPDNRDYSLEKFASDLDAVLTIARDQPAVLIGHSIGGMTMLTYAKLFPEALGTRVAGMILAHTTYRNPAYTMVPTWLLPAIQKPILEPILWLTVGLSPVLWLMNVLSYLNGSAHWSNHLNMFAGKESRGQLDFVSKYVLKASPAILARGVLGMFRYDATEALGSISIPVLVVTANKDITTIPEAGEKIFKAVSGAELVTLAPARHMGLVEHHAEFSKLVQGFCSSAQKPALFEVE